MVPGLSSVGSRLPEWGWSLAKATVHAFWNFYRRLSMVPMLIVTAVIGAIAIMLADRLPMPRATHAELRQLLGGALVLALLVIIIVGAVRGGRRS